MRIVVSLVVAAGAMFALAGGCGAIGIPEEWCGISSMTIWVLSVATLTGMWANGRA
jgi:hypothetical protein